MDEKKIGGWDEKVSKYLPEFELYDPYVSSELTIRDLVSGAETKIDLVPQCQLSLNTRQHILFNIGARVPVAETAGRDVQLVFYLLWDWFDGGFFDGW